MGQEPLHRLVHTGCQPCPFCGGFSMFDHYDGISHQVWCAMCGALGPMHKAREASVEKWNRRGQSETALLCTYGPPAERKRHWILKFEDHDVGDMHFDDEAEAMAMFDRCSAAYTCTLFVTAEDRRSTG